MATKKSKHPDEAADLMRTMIIVQLGLAGVPQKSIRAIAGCDMNRVSTILKHLKLKPRND